MTLWLFDTGRHEKRRFIPRRQGRVGLYVCGPTVYDRIHIGNGRMLVVFDVLARLLRGIYGAGNVTYVRNITDIDDKINARARERGIPIDTLTRDTIAHFHDDAAALGCSAPDVEPRATRHIPEMIAHITRLIAQGHAYALADGHVLFHVPSWPDYGIFAHKNRDEQVAGARVDIASNKRDPADFVLWKPSDDSTPGWPSPWCPRGRPGWHIECSAMSEAHLGPDFDIHGGGIDLVFPHHQNEIAQSCCAHPPGQRDDRFARTWMHNGYLLNDQQKMAKSLGNVFGVGELLADWPGEVLRFALLRAHYRQPLNFSLDTCAQAGAELDRLYRARRRFAGRTDADAMPPPASAADHPVLAALCDDLNTPLAIARLHECARQDDAASFLAGANLLGILQSDPDAWFQSAGRARPADGNGQQSGHAVTAQAMPDTDDIERLIATRAAARKAGDFTAADAIRDDLKAQGVILEDGPGGSCGWRRA